MKRLLTIILVLVSIYVFGQVTKVPIHYGIDEYNLSKSLSEEEIKIFSNSFIEYIKQHDSVVVFSSPKNANELKFSNIESNNCEWIGNHCICYDTVGTFKIVKNNIVFNDSIALTAEEYDSYLSKDDFTSKWKLENEFFEIWDFNWGKGTFNKEVKSLALHFMGNDVKLHLRTAPYTKEIINLNKGTDSTFSFTSKNIFISNRQFEFDGNQKGESRYQKAPDAEEINCKNGILNGEPHTYFYNFPLEQLDQLIYDIILYIKDQYQQNNPVVYAEGSSLTWDEVKEKVAHVEDDHWDTTRTYWNYASIYDCRHMTFHESWYFDTEKFALKKYVHGVSLSSKYEDKRFYVKFKNEIDGKVSPFSYPERRMLTEQMYTNGKQLFWSNGKLVLDEEFFDVNVYSSNYIKMEKLVGIDSIFDYNQESNEKLLKETVANTTFGIVDITGKVILEPEYSTTDIYLSGEHLGKAYTKNGYWGTMNEKWETVIPFEYQSFKRFGWEKVIAQENNKFGLIDFNNNVCINFEYEELSYIGNLKAKQNGLWGIIDSDGNSIVEFNYQEIATTTPNYVLAKKENKWGYIDYNENLLLPFEYDTIQRFQGNSDMRLLKKNNHYGALSIDKNFQIEFIYDSLGNLESHNQIMLDICEEQDYCFTKLLSCEYDTLKKFHDPFFLVSKNSKYGILASEDSIIITLLYDSIEYKYSHFNVKQNGKYALFSKKGEQLTDFVFDEMGSSYRFIQLVQIGDKYGIVNTEGKIIVPIKYKEIDYVRKSFNDEKTVRIRLDRKSFRINEEGKIIE